MAESFTNFASSILASGISSSDTSISIANGSLFPEADFYIVLGSGGTREIVYCSSRSGNTITAVTRGAQGTTATTHSAGAAVIHAALAHNFTTWNAGISGSRVELARSYVSVGSVFSGTTMADVVGCVISPKTTGAPLVVGCDGLLQIALNGAGAGTQVAIQVWIEDEDNKQYWMATLQTYLGNTNAALLPFSREFSFPNYYEPGQHLFRLRAKMSNASGQGIVWGGFDVGGTGPILQSGIYAYEIR